MTVVATACSVVTTSVAADNSSTDSQKTQAPAIQASTAYQAAEDQFRKYQEAYDMGDAKTLAGFYAEDVDYIDGTARKQKAGVKWKNCLQNISRQAREPKSP